MKRDFTAKQTVYEEVSEAETSHSARIESLVTWTRQIKWKFSLSCCGFKTFRRRIGKKVKQKQNWSPPPSSSIPMHMVHRVTKATTFFWLVSLNFFLLLLSCLCTGMLRMVFFFFPFFLSLFLLIFFLHAFFLLTQYGSKLD